MTQMQKHELLNNWFETTLGEVIDFVVDNRGKTPPIVEMGYELLEVNTVSDKSREPDYSKVSKFVDEKTFLMGFRKGTLKKGDVLIPTVGTIGNVSYSKQDRGAIAQNLIALRTNNENDSLFLYYFLANPSTKKSLLNLDIGGVQPSIKVPHLLNMNVIFPRLTEQQAIASILSSFDDKIELLREQNKTLETLGQTIFQEWFGKYSIDDELPDGWRVGKLGEVIENFDSKRVPIASDKREKGAYPYYGATGINDYVKDYIFDGVYTLLGEDGSVMKENGKPFTQYVWGKIRVNNHAHVLQGKKGFSTELIKIILDNTDITPYVNGAVQLKINQTNMNSIPVIIPTHQILNQFDMMIQSIFTKIRDNSEQIQSLSKTRDTLLPKLMSGEVRMEF